MNIALFDAAKYWSGGAERVYLCAKGFKEEGHNVVVVCLPTSRLNKLLKNMIKIYNIHPVTDLDILAGIKIFYILVKHKIEVIDVHSPKFYWLCIFIGRLLNKKVFITRNVEYRKTGIKKRINRILYDLCTGVVTVSKKVKDVLIKDFFIEDTKIKVIYDSFMIVPKQTTNLRKLYNISEQEIIISVVGRIEKNKRQDFAIEILQCLKQKGYTKFKMFIIGPVEEKKFYTQLQNKVKDYGLHKDVIFTGFVENVADYMSSSDIVLCCSEHESMGKTVVESLYCFTPVVSTSAVKVSEFLPQEYLHLLHIVDSYDKEKFVQIIENIINHLNFYRKQKEQLSSVFVENLSYIKMVKQYLDFYNICRS